MLVKGATGNRTELGKYQPCTASDTGPVKVYYGMFKKRSAEKKKNIPIEIAMQLH